MAACNLDQAKCFLIDCSWSVYSACLVFTSVLTALVNRENFDLVPLYSSTELCFAWIDRCINLLSNFSPKRMYRTTGPVRLRNDGSYGRPIHKTHKAVIPGGACSDSYWLRVCATWDKTLASSICRHIMSSVVSCAFLKQVNGHSFLIWELSTSMSRVKGQPSVLGGKNKERKWEVIWSAFFLRRHTWNGCASLTA